MKHLFVALILSAIVTPAIAAETPKQACERVIAEAEKGPKQMIAAGHLYHRGIWAGVKCVKVDYARAFELYVKGGEPGSANALLKELEVKVNAGMEGARIAMRRLEARGYMRVQRVEVR